jgi:hypothetical protein
MLSSICTTKVCADGLMKPHGFIRVIRKWRGMCINPVLRCFDNPEGLNNGDLPSWYSFRVCELANGLRIGTIMLSQDLSGAWVTVRR